MYVCICHGVTDNDIQTAARQGAGDLRDLAEELGVTTCCGKCKTCARQVLAECRNGDASANRHAA